MRGGSSCTGSRFSAGPPPWAGVRLSCSDMSGLACLSFNYFSFFFFLVIYIFLVPNFCLLLHHISQKGAALHDFSPEPPSLPGRVPGRRGPD